MLFRLRSYSHWPAKFSTSASDLRIGQHAPHLRFEHRRLRQLALGSPAPAARRPECCSTGRTTAAMPVRGRSSDTSSPAAALAGSRSTRNSELRARQHALERRLNAGFKAALGAPAQRTPSDDPDRGAFPSRDRRGARAGLGLCARRPLFGLRALEPGGTGRSCAGSAYRPTRVGLNGPVMVNVSICGCPVVSSLSFELRMNGCKRVEPSSLSSIKNAALMSCGPAFSGMRVELRASTSCSASVMLASAR